MDHRRRYRYAFFFLAVIISTWLGIALSANAQDDAVLRCDTLAADPKDPDRYSAGVPDEQFAPGAAIEACSDAVKTEPLIPRLWFQLGRAYWIAERDDEAVRAFSTAAGQGYAPAMKFLGDAFITGRGLPDGEFQSVETAIEWYREASQKGYRYAGEAEREAINLIASLRFDPKGFQNPDYMQRMYQGNFEGLSNPALFLMYVRAFTEQLGSETIFFVDPKCQGMVTALSQTMIGLQQIVSLLSTMTGEDAVADIIIIILGSDYVSDQGMRDAGILMQRHRCDSPVMRQVVDNVIGSYERFPAIMSANMTGNNSKKNSAPKAPVSVETPKLSKGQIHYLNWGDLAGRCPSSDKMTTESPCKELYEMIMDRSYRVLSCTYGPLYTDGTGFQFLDFWNDKVPPDFSSLSVQGEDHPFRKLGKNALPSCPKTLPEAEVIFAKSRI